MVPTENDSAAARRLFHEIGERFNLNRKKSKTAAYAGFRHDLMANMSILIMGGATDLKEITAMITGLEQYTRETEQESTETPATILGKWLRMSPGEVGELEGGQAEVESEVESDVDVTEIAEEESDEDGDGLRDSEPAE